MSGAYIRTQLSGRRLQNYGGTVHAKGLIAARLPDWLEPLLAKLHADTRAFGAGPPNHVLVNAYQPGEGIMAHQDGPLYHPGVCIVSCGAPAVIRFRRKLDDAAATSAAPPALSVLLLPRSLLVFADEAYTGCLHSIDFTDTEVIDASVANAAACGFQAGDRLPRGGERISLTVRRVCKVFSNLLKLK